MKQLVHSLGLMCWLLATSPAQAQSAESRTYTPGAFDSVVISGSATVRFTQGEADQVTVEGDESVQKSVSLRVDGNRLVISTSGSWKFWALRQTQIQLTARTLRGLHISGSASFSAPQQIKTEQLSVSISGAGAVSIEQLHAQALKFSISGSGEGSLAGQARTMAVAISGRGKFNGEQLASESASVAISGFGDVALWATEELSIAVGGFGTVEYWGSPRVKRAISGSADIRQRGDKPWPKP
jgi:hypothetical protein